ncbi:type II toxin-antitoxin system HipA family toxin [Butyrivibrio sp. XBB1001]|uniref:type II toxin-antitoxin system HipA family toxin n=1 Tax=Butyrivibrio sp. XBB1001 TaxID=1280682 RepID=UPI00040E8BBC|nr:type II toxin-antitoxin system HipA family toxin [Butyrivibrio sp. XBB1001]
MNNRKLDVYYHNKLVGTLAEMPDKRIAFQYSDDWVRDGFSISPRSLPLSNIVYVPPEKNRDIFHGLFGVFADSLPDSWGELLFDRYLSSVGIYRDQLTILDRLAYVGTSGMGALEYYPSRETDFDINNADLNYDELAVACANLISSKPSDQLDLLFKMAGSSGGTRPKILMHEDNEYYIIKFPAAKDPSVCGKREYDYSLCAKKCGIEMTDTYLVPSKMCEGYFKTKRFDRVSGEKIFSITFAALLEADFRAPSCDYSAYMRLIQILTKDNTHDKEQMFLTMCFNTLCHNRDDHTKNFSFIYTEGHSWRLAPAYDLTYSTTYFGEQTTSVNGKGKDVMDENLVKIGVDAGLSKEYCITSLERIKEFTQDDLGIYLDSKHFRKRKKEPLSKRISEIADKSSRNL